MKGVKPAYGIALIIAAWLLLFGAIIHDGAFGATDSVYVSYVGGDRWKPVDYIDPADKSWKGRRIDQIVGKIQCAHYFGVHKSQLDWVKAMIADTTDKWRVDTDSLKSYLHEPSYTDNFYASGGDKCRIINLSAPITSIFRDKKDVKNPSVLDVNAHSSGTKTISAAGDFATGALAITDLSATVTGALNYVYSDDVTETSNLNPTSSFDGNTVKIYSDDPPNGDITAGHKISINHTGYWVYNEAEGPGTLEIYDVRTEGLENSVSGRAMYRSLNITAAMSVKIHDCVFDMGGEAKMEYGLNLTDDTPIDSIYNNIFYDADVYGISFAGNSLSYIENNTVYSCNSRGILLNNNAVTCKNNVSYGNTTSDWHLIGSATGTYNSDGDGTGADGNWGTGSNNTTGVDDNDFTSVTDTESDFLDIEGASTTDKLEDTGGEVVLADTCIRGRFRDTPSIGAADNDPCTPSRDTTYSDTTNVDVCKSLDSLVAYVVRTITIDSISCVPDTTELSSVLDTLSTDVTLATVDTLVVLHIEDDDLVYNTVEGVLTQDSLSTTSRITTSGDTTFTFTIDSVKACSLVTIYTHDLNETDSIRVTISACPGNDTTALDTFATDTTYSDSTDDGGTTYCKFIGYGDTLAIDTTIRVPGGFKGIYHSGPRPYRPFRLKVYTQPIYKQGDDF